MNRSERTRKLLIVLLWIAVWEIAGLLIHNAILFVGPFDVIRAFIRLIPEAEFWRSIGSSLWKISIGTLSAFLLALIAGSAASRLPILSDFLEPMMLLMKTVPVASFVILALIWVGSVNLSVFTSFLVVFPSIYVSTIAGLQSTDKRLLEVIQVFRVSRRKQIRMIYLPALMPYLISSCRTALGMSWKTGIAAEVIGVPSHSIGEKLYMAKIYLSTADLFAWTIVIIAVSALFERFILWILQSAEHRLCKSTNVTLPTAGKSLSESTPQSNINIIGEMTKYAIELINISKSYGTLSVLHNQNITLEAGHIYCLMGASGSGKTTLLRLLLGLEQPDSGTVTGTGRPAAVFQEDRLCEAFSPLDNVLMVTGHTLTPEQIHNQMTRLLPAECLTRPVSTLSGGMKRRVAILRAILAPANVILMDEPFTGLDEDTKRLVIQYIRENSANRLLLITTHQEEDIILLGGSLMRL